MLDLFASFEVSADLPTLSGAAAGTFYSGNASGAGAGGVSQTYDTYAAGTPAAVGPGGTIGGPLLHDLGRGRRLLLLVQMVTTYLAAAGASTMQANLVADDDANGTNRQVVLNSNQAYPKATLVQGFRWPYGSSPGRIYNSAGAPARYVYMQYIIATNPCTTGKITSGLVLDVDDHAEVFGTI